MNRKLFSLLNKINGIVVLDQKNGSFFGVTTFTNEKTPHLTTLNTAKGGNMGVLIQGIVRTMEADSLMEKVLRQAVNQFDLNKKWKQKRNLNC